MAYTAIANLVKNDAFAAYFQRAMLDRSTLYKSGIISTDPYIQQKCNEAGFGGDFVTLPYFNALETGSGHEEEVLSESSNLTPDNVSANKDVAVICRRGKAFGANDLAAEVSGTDPMKVVADQLADYWNVRNQARLMAVLKGVFAANVTSDSSSLVLDISGETGTAGLLTKDTLLLAAQLLGDRKTELTAIAMNSMVETYLAGLDTNAGLYRASDGAATLAKYNGRDIIIDDTCRYNGTSSTADGLAAKAAEIYLFGRGAVAYGECPTKVPFEVGRNALTAGGQDFLVSRTSSIMHVRGYKWNVTTTNPANSVLATAGSWSKVWDTKEIRCVKLIARLA